MVYQGCHRRLAYCYLEDFLGASCTRSIMVLGAAAGAVFGAVVSSSVMRPVDESFVSGQELYSPNSELTMRETCWLRVSTCRHTFFAPAARNSSGERATAGDSGRQRISG